MFDNLSDKISSIFSKLRNSGVLKEADVDTALREIRIALLEADVSLDVARKFIGEVREKAVGQEVIRSVSPAQMVIKIVNDHLVELLGTSSQHKNNAHKILLVGLQGAGKTTTAAKLANMYSKQNKKIVMASADIYRPAAIEQLRVLTKKIENATFIEESEEMSCDEIVSVALSEYKTQNADMLIVDTAGRLHVDEMKMDEIRDIAKQLQPDEIFLVVDIMTGQDAINIAKKFSEALSLTGVILTRVDGDARGGVALSMKALTGCDIRYLCVGETINDLEEFDANRIASRMLGMGDIVALVEKAQQNFSQEEAMETARKMQEGNITLDDYAKQMEKMSNFGGLSGLLKMLPNSKQLEEAVKTQGVSDKTIAHNIAIIRSMTKKERKNYKIINGHRRKRIAEGSGTTIQDVNKLLKQFEGTVTIMKKLKNFRGLKNLFGAMK